MPVGIREGLGLQCTRKFTCLADSGWVAYRMDGLWGLRGVSGQDSSPLAEPTPPPRDAS